MGNHRKAFTVVELMVAVSVLTLIVLVLYSLFDQTQRAMRGNASQVDVLEGGRAAMEMMVGDLEQTGASGLRGTTNFFAQLLTAPSLQRLSATNQLHVNLQQEFFFLSSFNRQSKLVGYLVRPYRALNVELPVGTLYRVVLSNHVSQLTSNSLSDFYFSNRVQHLAFGTNALFQRVTDGVVHLHVRAYDANGRLMGWRTNNYPDVALVRDEKSGSLGESRLIFVDTALPTAVELELGVIEPQVADRMRSMPNPTIAGEYFARQAGRVHLFQQRIPIRTAR